MMKENCDASDVEVLVDTAMVLSAANEVLVDTAMVLLAANEALVDTGMVLLAAKTGTERCLTV